MKSQLRPLVAKALYPTKSYLLPSVCERYGLAAGSKEEAFASKNRYVLSRLESLSDQQLIGVAKQVLVDHPDEALQRAVEKIEDAGGLVTDLTRDRLADALNSFSLSGKRDLLELLRNHWPEIDRIDSEYSFDDKLSDDIFQHSVRNDDWSNAELLERVGFMKCSQSRLFNFLEDVVHPIRRDNAEQVKIVAGLNPLLECDGYSLQIGGRISGHPKYIVKKIGDSHSHPADSLISETLESFDEKSVHTAWKKALDRRTSDAEGAITASKTLLETVCKHVIEESGGCYGENDDLPKLYATAAEALNLAPSQHSEKIFKTILGNCQQVVGSLATMRNRLGDSHGQGKQHIKPRPRHAELAVNLAGTMALFVVSTWREKSAKPSAKD